MARAFTVRHEIDADGDAIWDVLTDPTRWTEWFAPIRTVDTPSPIPVDTPFAIELLDGSIQFMSVVACTSDGPDRTFAVAIHEGPIEIVHRYTLRAPRQGAPSTMVHVASATLRGPIVVFGPIYRQLGLRGERNQLDRLETAVLTSRR